MGFNRFMTFDPYLSFSDNERGFREKIFVRADGTPTATWYDTKHDGKGYLSSLWRIGRMAYKTVADRYEGHPTSETFYEIAASIKDTEKEIAPLVQKLISEGRLTLFEDIDSEAVSDLRQSLKDAPDGWLLEVFMRMTRPALISGEMTPDQLPDFEALLSAAAVMYIDDYIVAENIDAADLDVFFEIVQTNISSANLFRETVAVSKEAISAMGRRSARSRYEENDRQKAAALADWEAEGHKFSSMRAFSRECFKRYGVTDFMTVYNWLRKQRKSKV